MSYREEIPTVKAGDSVIIWPFGQNQILEATVSGFFAYDVNQGAEYSVEIVAKYEPYLPTKGQKRERVEVAPYESRFYAKEMQLLED